MARPAQFTSEAFVDAAIALVAEGGAGAATLQAIARRVGGPTGSIYHRFESRAAILVASPAVFAKVAAFGTLLPLGPVILFDVGFG